MKKRVSIVVPIYKETENVKKIIKNLKNLRSIYEVLFVDASYNLDIKKYIERNSKEFNFIYLTSEKGRAMQMNKGYRYSHGDVVLFLHCDSKVEYDVLDKIANSVDEGVEFGCLSIKFDDNRFLMKICSRMSRRRVEKRKIAFGDQGMFFTREYFEELGGFEEIPIMEDYDISIRAKEITPVIQIDSIIITSSRKYYSGKGVFYRGKLSFIGVLKTMLDMQLYQYRFRKGVPAEDIVKQYYKD